MGTKTVACPRCKTELDISGFKPGSRIRCGACNSVLRIPERKPAPAPAPVAAAPAPAPAPVPAPRPAPPPAPPPKDKDEELIGYAVGDEFEITKKLGEGGYGAVYEAMDRTLKRKVAIKLMLPARAANKEYVGKFLREARTAAQLSHPNVVHIHRVGFDKAQKSHFLAMEYVEGVTLHDILQERGPLEIPECIEIMEQCCEGLAVAHKKNIIHRDIKPGNLMVTPQKIVKIADFGLAKIFDAEEQAKSMVIGTPFFMPPEQFEGKATDGRTDIYALGVTFYYMLTMKRPFTGSTPAQILVNIMTQEPVPSHELRPGLDEAIWPIVRRMIHRDLDERYQDCDQILNDFKKFRKVEVSDDREACGSCGHMNADGAGSCGGCGESLEMQCPICGHPEDSGSRFCGECGCDMTLGLEVSALADEGKALLEGSHYQKAIEKFQEAREKDPANSDVMALLREAENRRDMLHTERTAVSALLASGDFDRAEERLTSALAQYPDDEHLLALKGDLNRARAASRTGAGIGTVRTLLKAKRFDNAREASERLMMSQGRTQELLDLLREAETALTEIDTRTQHAKELAASGTSAEVLEAWKSVLELNPDDTSARGEIEKIEKALGAADSLIEGANRLLEAGDPAQAVRQLADAGDLATSDPRVEEVINRARAALDELEVGAQFVRDEVTAGNLDDAETQRADLATKFGGAPTVAELEDLIRQARAASANKEAIDNVQSLLAEKQWEEARDDAEAFLAEGKESAEISTALGEAKASIEKTDGLLTQADTDESAGRLEDAALGFQEAMEISPGSLKASQGYDRTSAALEKLSGMLAEARAAKEAGESAKAADLFKQVLEVSPGHAEAETESAALEEAMAGRNNAMAEMNGALTTGGLDDLLAKVDSFEQSYPGDPDAAEVRGIAGTLGAARDAMLGRAERLLLAGQSTEAGALAEAALRVTPGDSRAQSLLDQARGAGN